MGETWGVNFRTLPARESVEHHLLQQHGTARLKVIVCWAKNGEGEGFQEINWLTVPVLSRE